MSEVERLWATFHEQIVAEDGDFEIKGGVDVGAVVSDLRGTFDAIVAAVRDEERSAT
jgi:hypothetical protein